jgi:hypothetical protein
MHPLSAATLVVRKTGLPAAEIDNEVVMLDADQGLYFSLNTVGTRIWQMLERRMAVTDICTALRAEYSVDAETCESQVIALLEDMRGRGLVEVCE